MKSAVTMKSGPAFGPVRSAADVGDPLFEQRKSNR